MYTHKYIYKLTTCLNCNVCIIQTQVPMWSPNNTASALIKCNTCDVLNQNVDKWNKYKLFVNKKNLVQQMENNYQHILTINILTNETHISTWKVCQRVNETKMSISSVNRLTFTSVKHWCLLTRKTKILVYSAMYMIFK